MTSPLPRSQPDAPTGGSRRWARITLVLAGVLAVVALAYAVPAVAMAGKVPRNTWAAGVEVGGLEPGDAQEKLRRVLSVRAVRPIAVRAGGDTVRMSPMEAGLTLDIPATVAAAQIKWPSPATVLDSLFGRRDVDLRIKVDHARLSSWVADFAETVDQPVQEGGIRYAGTTPRTAKPKNGRSLDRAASIQALQEAYLAGERAVTLPTRTEEASVSAAEIERVAATTARAAVAEGMTLTNGERTATLAPEALAAALRFVPDGQGGLRPDFNARKAIDGIDGELVDGAQAPRDASFKVVNDKPVVVPARNGQGVDTAALKGAVEKVVAEGGSRTIPVSLTTARPKLTTEKARALGIKEKLSSYTTNHPCCAPRVTNIHRIADILDGHLVMPGETFSLNGVVGKRDTARGFVEAQMILNGRFVNDVGGGISQFATTMFNAVFFGGLQDVQHMAHLYYISRYPAGRESTVSYPQPDFRWRNDSPYGVLVTTSYTSTSITVAFWSTKRFDIESESSARYDVRPIETLSDSGPECIPMEGVEGFAIDVWRIFKKDGKEVRRQKFHTVYAPEPRLTCDG